VLHLISLCIVNHLRVVRLFTCIQCIFLMVWQSLNGSAESAATGIMWCGRPFIGRPFGHYQFTICPLTTILRDTISP